VERKICRQRRIGEGAHPKQDVGGEGQADRQGCFCASGPRQAAVRGEVSRS